MFWLKEILTNCHDFTYFFFFKGNKLHKKRKKQKEKKKAEVNVRKN